MTVKVDSDYYSGREVSLMSILPFSRPYDVAESARHMARAAGSAFRIGHFSCIRIFNESELAVFGTLEPSKVGLR